MPHWKEMKRKLGRDEGRKAWGWVHRSYRRVQSVSSQTEDMGRGILGRSARWGGRKTGNRFIWKEITF